MSSSRSDDGMRSVVYYSVKDSLLQTVLVSIRMREPNHKGLTTVTALMLGAGGRLLSSDGYVSLVLATQLELEVFRACADEQISLQYTVRAVEWAVVPGGPPAKKAAMKEGSHITYTPGYPLMVPALQQVPDMLADPEGMLSQ